MVQCEVVLEIEFSYISYHIDYLRKSGLPSKLRTLELQNQIEEK